MVLPLPQLNFNNNVPLATNNPSADQGPMLSNNISNQSIWDVDHIGFNTNGTGYHQQVRMPNYTTTPITPIPPVIAGMGGTYCDNTISTGATNETGLWYTPDASGNKYQLTRTVTASFATFGNNINNYTGSNTALTGGWSFLPGGLLLQYGRADYGSSLPVSGTITYPVRFDVGAFSIQMTLTSNNGTPGNATVSRRGDGPSSFAWESNSSSSNNNYDGFYWVAIGK